MLGTKIGNVETASAQVEEDQRFKQTPTIDVHAMTKGLCKAGVDWVHFPGVDLPLTLGARINADALHEIGVLKVGKVVMQAILAAGNALRLEAVMKTVDAEATGGISEQVADQVTQWREIADAVTLDDIAQDDHINVLLQDSDAMMALKALHLGKPSCFEISTQTIGKHGTTLAAHGGIGYIGTTIFPLMPQCFTKAERKYFRSQ